MHALAACPLIDLVSFTGGTESGRETYQRAAANLKPVLLELGGKSANVVFADADLQVAATAAIQGFIRNQGATCTSATRILVEASARDEFEELLTDQLRSVTVGDPYDSLAELGAVRTAEIARLASDSAAHARSRGRLIGELKPLEVHNRQGVYLSPAIAADLPMDDEVNQNELFAPIATLTNFESEEEAVALANGTSYGLAAGVWTADSRRAERFGRQLRAGTVYVNHYHRIDGLPLPSSGRGSSGFGLEGGWEGIQAFQISKSMHFRR